MATRMQSCWRGVRRGARFGAFAGVVIWLAIVHVMVVMVLVVPGMSEGLLQDFRKDWERWGVFGAIGSIAAPFALMAMYGAMGGILVMGIAGFLRPNPAVSTGGGEASLELAD